MELIELKDSENNTVGYTAQFAGEEYTSEDEGRAWLANNQDENGRVTINNQLCQPQSCAHWLFEGNVWIFLWILMFVY